MKSFYHIIIVLAMFATTWVGCSTEDTLITNDCDDVQEENTTFSVNMNISIPDPIKITSRNSISDAIETITLLCFNGQGKLVRISESIPDRDNHTMTADITYSTRVMHFIANYDFSDINLDVKNFTENDMTDMIVAENTMVYWARVEIPAKVKTAAQIDSWFETTFNAQNPILLLRNQAKITVESDVNAVTKQPYFVVTDFRVYNTSESGTVAPYHDKKAFPTLTLDFNLNAWAKENYVSLPDDVEIIEKIDDDNKDGEISPLYVYETDDSQNPFIVLGGYNFDDETKTPKYWRVSFTGPKGESLLIRRNHHYAVKITGVLNDGYDSPDKAADKNASTANDAFLSISSEVTALTDGKASLTVQDTYFEVANGTESLTFIFSVKKDKAGNEDVYKKNLSITWDEDNGSQNVSDLNDLKSAYTIVDENGQVVSDANVPHTELNGTISISLNRTTNDQSLVGVLLIKYGEKLQRRVTIKVLPKYSFENIVKDETLKPTNPYTDPIATLTFTIPEEYPAESFPFNVLISTNDFTVINSAGAGLPIIYPGDGGYVESQKDDMGYKYVFQVSDSNTRTHTIKLISNHGDVINVTEKGNVILESKHFISLPVEISLLTNK